MDLIPMQLTTFGKDPQKLLGQSSLKKELVGFKTTEKFVYKYINAKQTESEYINHDVFL